MSNGTSLGYTLADSTGFVQFALGVGSATAFRTRLVSLGIPFAVTALALIAAWSLGSVLCGRTATKLAATRWLKSPAAAALTTAPKAAPSSCIISRRCSSARASR